MRFRPLIPFLLVLASIEPARADKLEEVDDAAKKTTSRDRSGTGSESRNSSRSGSRGSKGSASRSARRARSEDDSDHLFLHIIAAPWSIPYYATRAEKPVFSHRPFDEGCGLFCLDEQPTDPPTKTFALHVEMDGGYEWSGLPLAEVGLRLESMIGFGISTRWSGYREQHRGDVDYALMSKTDVFYRFATSRWVQFRSGLGLRYWAGPTLGTLGLDVLYALDIQWGRPVASTIEFNVGSLGRAFAIEARGTMDVYIGRLRLYAGWDQSWIGGVDLGGPLAGVGGYF